MPVGSVSRAKGLDVVGKLALENPQPSRLPAATGGKLVAQAPIANPPDSNSPSQDENSPT